MNGMGMLLLIVGSLYLLSRRGKPAEIPLEPGPEPTPPKNYPCPYCQLPFASEAQRDAHVASAHPGVPLPPATELRISSITIDKRNMVEAEGFTISITFTNPHSYDVWVRPRFAFGAFGEVPPPFERKGRELPPPPVEHVDGFTLEPVLAGAGWVMGVEGVSLDLYKKEAWHDLSVIYWAGSGMTRYVYDPDGKPLVTGEYAYLLVPANSQATTSGSWHISHYARSRYYRPDQPGPVYGWQYVTEVYPPIDLGVCVQTVVAFGVVWDAGADKYVRLRLEPIVSIVPDVVNISSTKTPTV